MRHMALERPAGSPPCTPFMPVLVRSVRSRTTAASACDRRALGARAWRTRPARLARVLEAPLQLDHAAHDVGGAGRRRSGTSSRPGATTCPRRPVDPVGHAAALDGQPLLLLGAPPLRGVAGEDPLVRAVAGHARADADGVRRLRGVADVHGRPEGPAVAGVGRLDELAALATRSPPVWPLSVVSAAGSATTMPGGARAAPAPAGRWTAAAGRRRNEEAAQARRTVGAASRGTTRGTSGRPRGVT